MPHEETAWAEIRRAYEAGGETVSALAKRLRISEGAIYRRARRDGWARRSKTKTQIKSNNKTSAPPRRSTADGPARDVKEIKTGHRNANVSAGDLIARLYNAMDAKLKRLEARITADEELSAAESERETRELGSMIRSFEKVTAFAASIEERDKSGKRKATIAPGDAERMREEIAQRLERICTERQPAKQSGEPE